MSEQGTPRLRRILRLTLPDGTRVDAVREEGSEGAILSIRSAGTDEASLRQRISLDLTKEDSESIARFFLGMRDERVTMERVTRETTQPGPPRGGLDSSDEW